MLNLLPEQQKKSVLLQYRLRLGVVISIGLSIVLAVAIAFLVPTFVYSRIISIELENQRAQLEEEAKESGRFQLAEDLKKWRSLTGLLNTEVGEVLGVAESAHLITEAETSAIEIDGFEFMRVDVGGVERVQLRITGISRDRQSLFDFQKKLNENEMFETVELPVSNFAANINIDFTMTITLKDM